MISTKRGFLLERCRLSYAKISVALAGALALGGGCGLDGLLGYIPTAEELESYSRELDEFRQQVEELPSLSIRIVNHTDTVAGVELRSGLTGPEPDFFDDITGLDTYYLFEEPGLTGIEDISVLIAAGGTVTGEIKCGEVIGVSSAAPFDGVSFGYQYGGSDFGLYLSDGNIHLIGIGESGGDFEGDVISLTRFVRIDQDDIDCETAVLVIEIDTPASGAVIDEESGEIIQPKTAGSGTIRVE